MGTFSKIHRFHEAGQKPNVINTETFGEPAKSLYTKRELFTVHKHIDVFDDDGNILYRAGSKFPSILDKTDIWDAQERHVAHMERKLFSFHQRHFVNMEDGSCFELSNELFHLIEDVIDIDGPGWRIMGNILALNFVIYDRSEKIVALVGQKMVSIHDKYCIDIYQPEHEKTIVAIVITLQHMIWDRQSASFSSSSSSSSGS